MSSEQTSQSAPVQPFVTRDLDTEHGDELPPIELKPGMAWALVVDDGPGGPCGQSMRTTCPHARFFVWPNEAAMRKTIEEKNLGRRGSRERSWHGVVGEWASGGVFGVTVFDG